MNKIKTAFNNFVAQFVKTFEVNKTKPSYWLQIIGSLLIIGLAVGSAFFGLKIDRSDVLMVFTVIGSVLAFVGTVTDNSILEHVGDDIKDNSDSLTKSEQDVLNKLIEAQKAIEDAKTSKRIECHWINEYSVCNFRRRSFRYRSESTFVQDRSFLIENHRCSNGKSRNKSDSWNKTQRPWLQIRFGSE